MSAKAAVAKVQIVGVGACTALGADAPSTAAAVRAAIAGFGDHPYMIDKAGDPMVVARASYLLESPSTAEHFAALAIPAAKEALSPLTEGKKQVTGIPLILGLPPTRPGRPANLDTEMAERFKSELGGGALLSAVRAVPCGHTSGLAALEQGWRLIRSGDIDACLIGGVDSYEDADTLEWLDELEQLHSNTNKWGFIPGEAAGFVLLSSAQFAQKHKLPNLGEVLEVALAQEKNLIKTEAVCIGEGLSAAVRQVLEAMTSKEKPIHQTLCDLNGERYRATEFGYTLTRTGNRFADAGEYTAPADCWGDVGAASAPLLIGLAVAAGQKGYAAGPNTLIWASSEAGERAAAIIRIEAVERKA
jgi:3-oxoacyl-[acyl-carrier-protein] synthase-1